MAWMIDRMRSMTRPKSARPPSTSMPKSAARRSVCSTEAERMSALEGTQPVHRHSPPSLCCSTSAVRAPIPADTAEATSPAVPPPITARS
jgi:hypothetical protein